MGGYYNDELRHRQMTGDVGHAVLGDMNSASTGRRWRALLFPMVVLALGLLLTYVGPVPGLGVGLVVGAMVALPIVVIKALLSP